MGPFILILFRSNPFNHWKIHFYSYNICINNSKTSPHKTRHELLLCENCKIGAFVTTNVSTIPKLPLTRLDTNYYCVKTVKLEHLLQEMYQQFQNFPSQD